MPVIVEYERRVAIDRQDCYWLYVVTSCKSEPILQEPIKNPARWTISSVVHRTALKNLLRLSWTPKETKAWKEFDEASRLTTSLALDSPKPTYGTFGGFILRILLKDSLRAA
jgi:hypothetical protein